EAGDGGGAHGSDLVFGQRRIAFENKGVDRVLGGRAHDAGKAHHGAGAAARRLEASGLGARVERIGGDADHRQPPVMGGRMAISRAPASRVSGGTIWASRASLNSAGLAMAWSSTSSRRRSQATRSASVSTSGGGSMSSLARSRRSRSQAKYSTFICRCP